MPQVDIPVVIDIDQAFDDAARRVDAASKPFVAAVNNVTKSLKITLYPDSATPDTVKLDSLLKDMSKYSMNRLVEGLAQVDERLNKSYASLQRLKAEGQSVSAYQREQLSTLQEAAILLRSEIDLRTSGAKIAQQAAERAIAQKNAEEERNAILLREANTISGLNERLGALRGKIENIKPRSKEWTATTNEIEKTTAALAKFETKAGSINRINREMQALNEKWNAMSRTQKFDKDGNLKKSAQLLIDKYKELAKETEKYGKSLESYAKSGNSELKKQVSLLKTLTVQFASYLSAHTLLRFARQIRDVTGELEYQRVALQHLLRDEQYGAELFERIKEMAIESPFRIKQLVTYTKQLAAYRIETSKLFDTTKRLADISAGLGVDMNRLILAYGQVRAASVLRGQELRQFTEAGIPLVELLAEKFTELEGRLVSTGDVFERISKRAVPFRMISEIFEDLTDKGGMFYQMQERQAKTLQGRWEKLKDAYDIALQSIGETDTFQRWNDMILGTLRLLAKTLRVVPKLLTAITRGWIAYSAVALVAAKNTSKIAREQAKLTAEETKQIKAIPALTIKILGQAKAEGLLTKAIIRQRTATTALSRAFWKLTAAMISNPIGAIAAGIAGLTALFFTFRKKTNEVDESLKSLDESIEGAAKSFSEYNRMDSLIDRYGRLAQKTNLTAKEQQMLSQTMMTLQSRFKNFQLSLDQSNKSIPEQVENLKRLNKQQRAQAEALLKTAKANIELELSKLTPRQGALTGHYIQQSRDRQAYLDVPQAERTRKQTKAIKQYNKEISKTETELEEVNDQVNSLYRRLASIDEILNPSPIQETTRQTGDRLKKLRQGISDITNAYKKYTELLKYESKELALKDITTLFPSLKGAEPSYSYVVKMFEKLLGVYSGDKEATRLLEQAFANFRFDKIKDYLETQVKKASDEMKRSEVARKFYENILGLTGDKEMATSLAVSVYGTAGEDFKERIQKMLESAFDTFDASDFDLWDKMRIAVESQDWDFILSHIEKFGSGFQSMIKTAASDTQGAVAQWLGDIIKTYEKAKTYEERQTDIINREEEARKKIRENANLSDAEKESLINASRKKQAQDIAKVQLEAMKDTYTWTKAFEDLDGVSTNTLNNLIALIDDYINIYGKDLEPQQLKELARARENAKAQLLSRNAFKALGDAASRYAAASATIKRLQDEGKEKTEEYTRALDDQQRAIKDLGDSFEKVQDDINQVISSTKDLISTFASDDTASYYGEQLDNLTKTVSGVAKAGVGIAQIAAGNVTPQAILQTVSGIADVVSGIFNAGQAARIRRVTKALEEQDRILSELEYSYSRLEDAIAGAFGSDYIEKYNEQLDVLIAKQKAYEEQARLEREKGKKKDEDKIRDYEQNAREVADQIRDMQSQLAEFFTGTDVTSAATDFANAWIEAYKEFGSTTDAMREKFQDLIENMVTQSLAAQLMKTILQPLFKEIDDYAKSGGELTAGEIADIARKSPEYIERINNAMTTLMNQLAAAGYNVRQKVGSFTGISRDIAGASEESITGLAAGINTQNFFLQHIDQNVALILSALTGGTTTTQASVTGQVADPYKDAMLEYAAYIPQMHNEVAAIRSLLGQVIKPVGTSSGYRVIIG